MITQRHAHSRRFAVPVLTVMVSLAVASLGTAARAGTPAGTPDVVPAPVAAAADCPAVVPVKSVRAGMRGEGRTVVRGTTPQPFNVEVLGVLEDAVAPGRDLIIVELSDLAGRHVIDAGGGIWAGMSGSPVYLNGKLLGAVSYGLSFSPSPIGGVTPAADMMNILKLPKASTRAAAEREQSRIALPQAFRQKLADRGLTAAAARPTLDRLPMPLSVGGLGPQLLARLQSQADRANLNVIAHAGGRGSAPTKVTAMTRPQPGGNFAAAVSYGDLTLAAIGTTTAVCGGQALAFGHPFQLAGASMYGSNDATSLAIIKDQTFGSSKFATIGAPAGTVDQDRLSGVRTALGVIPATIPFKTTIRNVDLNRTRTGTTQVADQNFLPTVAVFGVTGSYATVFEELGDGRTSVAWTIEGTRHGGAPFTLTRTNRWASQVEVTSEPALDLGLTLDALLHNEFEPVKVNRVTYNSSIGTEFRQLRIVDAKVSVNGKPFVRAESLEVPPNAQLRARVTMLPFASRTAQTVDLAVRVPANAAGREGTLSVSGGGAVAEPSPEAGIVASGCLLTAAGCVAAVEDAPSFDGLLREIRNAPRNDDLTLNLDLEDPDGAMPTVSRSQTKLQKSVVTGLREIGVTVTG
jgi:hypothetical protein